jgi:segregation and condensation protein B
MNKEQLKNILESILMAADEPVTLEKIGSFFVEEDRPSEDELRAALMSLSDDYHNRAIEIKEVSSGFRIQVKQQYAEYVAQLWQDKPPRYSRACLETLALIAYRQPITRAQVEEIRGVNVSTNIMKTLIEREWVRVVGHKETPGRPELFATTKTFLDDMGLQSLNDLPTLQELSDFDKLETSMQMDLPFAANQDVAVQETEPSLALQVSLPVSEVNPVEMADTLEMTEELIHENED